MLTNIECLFCLWSTVKHSHCYNLFGIPLKYCLGQQPFGRVSMFTNLPFINNINSIQSHKRLYKKKIKNSYLLLTI